MARDRAALLGNAAPAPRAREVGQRVSAERGDVVAADAREQVRAGRGVAPAGAPQGRPRG